MSDFASKLCNVERDRVTAAEICIDELLTILDRHEVTGFIYEGLQHLSAELSDVLLVADGPVRRRDRLIRVRRSLTDAFPMTDEDLEARPTQPPPPETTEPGA